MDIQRPRISVVIPTFQEEKIISNCLKFFNNKIKSKYFLEIIVSDGGSTDNTVEISRPLCDKIAIHSNANKQTIAEGRNKGAELAEADYIVFINSDTYPADLDYFFSTILQWTNNEGKYKDADALACYVEAFPDDIIWKDRIFYPLQNMFFILLNSLGMGMGRGECQIVKKSIFDKIGGYNPMLAAGEDVDLFRRISKNYKVIFAKDLVVYESPRRFRREGYLKTLLRWSLNDIYVRFYKKSYSKEWKAIR